MVEEKLNELSNALLDVIENQKTIQKELAYLRDDLKAQNRLITELLKIHKVHQETSNKHTKLLEKITKELEAIEFIAPHEVQPVQPPVEPQPEVLMLTEEPEPEAAPPIEQPEPEVAPPIEQPEPEAAPPIEQPEPEAAPPIEQPEPEIAPPIEQPEPEIAPPIEQPKPEIIPPTEEPKPEVVTPTEQPVTEVAPPTEQPEPQPLNVCKNCGRALEPAYMICPYCGAQR